MTDLQDCFPTFSEEGFEDSGTTCLKVSGIPSINVGGLSASPASPQSEIWGKSFGIKRQLSQSLQGHSGGVSVGGITKPKSRRNSAYHIKSEEGLDAVRNHIKDEEAEEGKVDQGIERKRRDNINEKIQELLTLIPRDYFAERLTEGGSAAINIPSSSGGQRTNVTTQDGGDDLGQGAHSFEDALANSKSTGTRDGKPNKGQILTHAVDYIQYLQNLIDENNRQEVKLYLKLKSLENQAKRKSNSSPNVPIAVEATSAEKALGEIGVGPESEPYFRKVLLDSSSSIKTET